MGAALLMLDNSKTSWPEVGKLVDLSQISVDPEEMFGGLRKIILFGKCPLDFIVSQEHCFVCSMSDMFVIARFDRYCEAKLALKDFLLGCA